MTMQSEVYVSKETSITGTQFLPYTEQKYQLYWPAVFVWGAIFLTTLFFWTFVIYYIVNYVIL